MISRYAVWLNDQALADVDPDIYINDISYKAISKEYNKSRPAGRDGVYSAQPYIESNSVTVSFTVRRYSTRIRQEVVQNVARWCSEGGWLKTSDRPSQKLYVRCTKLPTIGSVMRWLDAITVEFTAYDHPYWVDEYPLDVDISSGDETSFWLNGVEHAPIEATITANEALTAFSIYVGNTTIALSGLNIAQGGTVEISYTDEHHILEIKSGTTSLLDKRTGNDDLIAIPGENAAGFICESDADCILHVKGGYL